MAYHGITYRVAYVATSAEHLAAQIRADVALRLTPVLSRGEWDGTDVDRV